MSQQKIEHPLEKFGFKRTPHWLWRLSPRAFVFASSLQDIWLIVTGRLSLHRAWQAGHDHGTWAEYQRVIINGGR